MGNQKMGFEGQIFYGTAGSTGSTLLTNTTDQNYDFDKSDGNTTVRGDGSVAPIETGSVTSRKTSIGWTMVNDITDTALQALLTAAYAGTAVALRLKDYAAGKGFDGDCTLAVKNGRPINGEQTYVFTATPTRDAGRMPLLYT